MSGTKTHEASTLPLPSDWVILLEGTSTDSEDDQSSDEEDPPSVPKEAAIGKRASIPDYLINH